MKNIKKRLKSRMVGKGDSTESPSCHSLSLPACQNPKVSAGFRLPVVRASRQQDQPKNKVKRSELNRPRVFLGDLPPELILDIAEQLVAKRDLWSLSLTSSWLHEITKPVLYSYYHFNRAEPKWEDRLCREPYFLLRTLIEDPAKRKLVKTVRVVLREETTRVASLQHKMKVPNLTWKKDHDAEVASQLEKLSALKNYRHLFVHDRRRENSPHARTAKDLLFLLLLTTNVRVLTLHLPPSEINPHIREYWRILRAAATPTVSSATGAHGFSYLKILEISFGNHKEERQNTPDICSILKIPTLRCLTIAFAVMNDNENAWTCEPGASPITNFVTIFSKIGPATIDHLFKSFKALRLLHAAPPHLRGFDHDIFQHFFRGALHHKSTLVDLHFGISAPSRLPDYQFYHLRDFTNLEHLSLVLRFSPAAIASKEEFWSAIIPPGIHRLMMFETAPRDFDSMPQREEWAEIIASSGLSQLQSVDCYRLPKDWKRQRGGYPHDTEEDTNISWRRDGSSCSLISHGNNEVDEPFLSRVFHPK